MLRFRNIALTLLVLLAISACGPKKISKGDMEEIFYEMFIQDQILKQDRTLRQMADTSLVYAGILESRGYDTDDYLYSLHEYLAEPEDMEKIMGNVAERIEKELKVVRSEVALEAWRDKMLSIYSKKIDTTKFPKPRIRPVDTLKVRFEGDSAYLHKEIDSLKLIPRDSLIFLRDTVEVKADTLLAAKDSLAVQKDSL